MAFHEKHLLKRVIKTERSKKGEKKAKKILTVGVGSDIVTLTATEERTNEEVRT